MKKKLLKFSFGFSIALLTLLSTAYAQQAGDYRSSKSGNWGSDVVTTDTWETYNGSTWVPTSTAPMSTLSPAAATIPTITIKAGHVVTLNGTTVSANVPIALTENVNTANNLVIEDGAVLKSGATDGVGAAAVKALRIARSVTTLGTGTLGTSTAAERVTVELYNSANTAISFTGPTGTTTYYLVDLYANPIVTTLAANLNGDMNLSGNLRGYYNLTVTSGQDDDNVSVNINKTVSLVTNSSAAFLHGGSATNYQNNVAPSFGNYTYNINGTLAMGPTGTSCIVAPTNTSGSVTVNTNGLWITGNAMRIATTYAGDPAGNAFFNINNGGVVAANTVSKPTNLVAAPNAASTKTYFFNIVGSGILQRHVTASSSGNLGTFPVGSNGTYSPVTLTTTGEVSSFSVGVRSIADNGKKILKKAYTILPDSSDVTNVKLALGHVSVSDWGTGYDTATPTIYYFDTVAKAYTPIAAVNSGSGTPSSPKYANSNGSIVQSFGTFIVGNETPTALPLDIVSFKATLSQGQTKLTWTTANEVNTKLFVLERSADGKKFGAIGDVSSINATGTHSYSFIDVMPISGSNYYRLKQVDKDGKYKYSQVVFVKVVKGREIAIYNRGGGNLTVFHEATASNASVRIINTVGQSVLATQVVRDANQTNINVSKLSAGSYVIVFENAGEKSSKVFIKQ